jgi:hypothetical protein
VEPAEHDPHVRVPPVLAASRGFRDSGPDAARANAAAAQVALHLALALYAGRATARVFRDPRLFAPTFAVLALNPILLLRATEMLSDSVSASLVGFAVFLSLPEGRPAPRAFGAFLCAASRRWSDPPTSRSCPRSRSCGSRGPGAAAKARPARSPRPSPASRSR